jgi:hypothetical protein
VPVSKREIEGFIDMAEGPRIEGDPVPGSRKANFLRTGKRILKSLAVDYLKLQPGTFDLKTNPGGIAVSGEVMLHGESVYVHFEQGGVDGCFRWRLCKGRKDYTGGPNRWSQWGSLLNLEHVADEILVEIDVQERQQAQPLATAKKGA